MPVNEIEAPQYLKVKYSTPVASHNLTLYFAEPTEFLNNVDPGQSDGNAVIPYTEIVGEVLNRAKALGGVSISGVNTIEIWAGNVIGQNTFQGFAEPPVIGGGAVGHVASSYRMWIYGQINDRQKMRLTLFEAVSASPQKFTEGQPPAIDDGTLSWYVLKSGVPFSTQDGLRVTTYLSLNQGYNRKLARSYGRELQP